MPYFLRKPLHGFYYRIILPIRAKAVVAALVLLASDNFATFLVEFQLDALLLALLTLLLIRRFLFFAGRSLEDLGLHREKLIQRDAILVLIVLRLFSPFASWFFSCLL